MEFRDFSYFWENIYKDFIDTTVRNVYVKLSEIFDFYIYKDDNDVYMNQWYFIRDSSDRDNPVGFYGDEIFLVYQIFDKLCNISSDEELKTFITKLDNNGTYEDVPDDIYVTDITKTSNFLRTNVQFATDIEKPRELADLTYDLLETYNDELNLFNVGYYMNDVETMLSNIPKINYKSGENLSLLFEFPYVNFLRLQKLIKCLDIVYDCMLDLDDVLVDNQNDVVIIVLVTVLNIALTLVLYTYLDELNLQQESNELLYDLFNGFYNNNIIDANVNNYFNNIYSVSKLYDLSYLDIYIEHIDSTLQKIYMALS